MMKKLFVSSAAVIANVRAEFAAQHYASFEAIGPNGAKFPVFLTHGGVDGTTTGDAALAEKLERHPETVVVCCHQAAIAATWGCKTLFDKSSDELYIFWRTKGRPHLEVWDESPDLHMDGITII